MGSNRLSDHALKAGDVVELEISPSIRLRLVWCPAGKYLMGSNETRKSGSNLEKPAHVVAITRGFWIGATPVTIAQWLTCMSPETIFLKEGTKRKEDGYPAELMTWYDAKQFCEVLTAKLREKREIDDKRIIGLPHEEQWEYACRAGTETEWYFGNESAELADHAWYKENSNSRIYPVGLKKPNPWGMYDIYGNVAEWCVNKLYRYDKVQEEYYYSPSSETRMVRGGSFFDSERHCNSYYRIMCSVHNTYNDPIGFRVVCIESV